MDLDKLIVQKKTRVYAIKHKVSGEYYRGIFAVYELDFVPGYKRRKRVRKEKILYTPTPPYNSLSQVNNNILDIIKKGMREELNDMEIISFDVIVGTVERNGLNMDKKKTEIEKNT